MVILEALASGVPAAYADNERPGERMLTGPSWVSAALSEQLRDVCARTGAAFLLAQ